MKEIIKIIETSYSCIFENYYKVVHNPIFDKKQAQFRATRKYIKTYLGTLVVPLVY
jgi:hypothetical protein